MISDVVGFSGEDREYLNTHFFDNFMRNIICIFIYQQAFSSNFNLLIMIIILKLTE